MNTNPRILLWDIETMPNVAAVFRLFGQDYISPDNLLQERYMVCASWMWLGEDEVHSVSVLDDPKRYKKDPHNDYAVLKKLHEVMHEADVIVHHNGRAFDSKYLATRLLIQGFSPLPPIPQVDTMAIAKRRFMFNSNKLDYIAKALGVGRKLHTSIDLWMTILKGGKEAEKSIEYMVEYNQQDVFILRDVFLKLRPWYPDYINRLMFNPTELACPFCGSKQYQSRGEHKAKTRSYKRYQCSNKECQGWFSDVTALKPSAKLKVI